MLEVDQHDHDYSSIPTNCLRESSYDRAVTKDHDGKPQFRSQLMNYESMHSFKREIPTPGLQLCDLGVCSSGRCQRQH